MDVRNAFFELLERRFSHEESARIVSDWLVHVYAPYLDRKLARCEDLSQERFDLEQQTPLLPLLTPSVVANVRTLLAAFGFVVDGTRVALPDDRDAREAVAERVVAAARQVAVLDAVAAAVQAAVTDYVYMMQPNAAATAAIDWLTGPFLEAAEALSAGEVGRVAARPWALLPASVATEARKLAPGAVPDAAWPHVVTVLTRLGYRLKTTSRASGVAILEVLAPPNDEFTARVVIAALRYLRDERAHIRALPDTPMPPQAAAAIAPAPAGDGAARSASESSGHMSLSREVTAAFLLPGAFGDCEAVRERKAREALELTGKQVARIRDVTDLVDVLVHVIEDSETAESLEDRRSLKIAAELADVRRRLESMQRQSQALQSTNMELKQLFDASQRDIQLARARIIELERAAASVRVGPPAPPAALPPPGMPPPPPPPPPPGAPRVRRLPRAAEEEKKLPLERPRAPPRAPLFDPAELQRAAEARQRRADAAAARGTEATTRLRSDADAASNELNAAASSALQNARAKAVNPVLAAAIRKRQAERAAALPPPPERAETEAAEKLLEQLRAAAARRRRAIEGTPGAELPPEPFEARLAALYSALAPYCFAL